MAEPSRRTFLSGGAGAAVIASMTDLASAGHAEITPIQILWREYQASLREYERLSEEDNIASERFNEARPSVPEELGMSSFWMHYYGLTEYRRNYRRCNQGPDPDGFTWVCAAGWRHALDRPPVPSESCEIHLMYHFRALAREKLAIAEKYEADLEEVRVRSGSAAAFAAYDAAFDRRTKLEKRIMAQPASSLADIACQNRIVESYDGEWGVEELTASLRQLTARGGFLPAS